MAAEAPGPRHDWLDTEAGPVVRPYTVTGGRVRPAAGAFDVVAFVLAAPAESAAGRLDLQPEHRAILELAQQPVSVAELASDLDLALGVVRVLLGDLLADGLVSAHEPSAAAEIPDDDILKAVVNGLRAL
jgi:ethanolamine utilization microcompartment shell protein EutS